MHTLTVDITNIHTHKYSRRCESRSDNIISIHMTSYAFNCHDVHYQYKILSFLSPSPSLSLFTVYAVTLRWVSFPIIPNTITVQIASFSCRSILWNSASRHEDTALSRSWWLETFPAWDLCTCSMPCRLASNNSSMMISSCLLNWYHVLRKESLRANAILRCQVWEWWKSVLDS